MNQLHADILRTLLYYDIWHHPLTAGELYSFLPSNSISPDEFNHLLENAISQDSILHDEGYYFVRGKTNAVIQFRRQKERHARSMWRMAGLATRVIKQFPFVRAVFVSGDLSKNVTNSKSDVDFFILTEPGRLWITRTLLISFKKIFLFNSKKYFCINYLSSTDHLVFDEQNLFTATEIATLKPLYGSALFSRYLEANKWIRSYFPNFSIRVIAMPQFNDRVGLFQRLLEWPFRFIDAEQLDIKLMNKMQAIWRKRYPDFDEETHARIFRCTRDESRAYIGNFQEKILALYEQRLKQFGVVC